MRFRFALIVLCASGVLCAAAGAQKVSVGIAPVFDGGGEAFGPVVAQHLTLFVYQDLLQSHSARPALLSPGGVYSPLDTSWLVEYVQDRPDLKLLLVATLKPVQNPSKQRWIIPVELELLDARSGNSVANWTVTTEISSQKTLLDYGQLALQQAAEGKYEHMKETYVGTPSRDFEKQQLGKATAQIASSIRSSLEAKLVAAGMANATSEGALVPVSTTGGSTPCTVNLRITYAYKHSASHSYQVIANGLDQSFNLKDGLTAFPAAEGELLLQFSVNDAPYKLQKESLYQVSVDHSCKFQNLTLDLGPGGDAHIHWN